MTNLHDLVGLANGYDQLMTEDDIPQVPAALRMLVSWQANRVGLLGNRLTLQHMSATDRSDFAVLATLDEFGELSQADIGRHLTLDRNDINAIATRLDQHGLIDRRTDLHDRRRKTLSLTQAGIDRFRSLQASAEVVQHVLLAGLTPAEQKQLTGILDKLIAAHSPLPV